MNSGCRRFFQVLAARPSIRISLLPAASCLASDIVPRCRISAYQTRWNTTDPKKIELVYENRYAFLVTRLKSVSLITCGLGLFGMPALISIFSGDLPLPTQCLLAVAAVFSGGTTTVALAFVFDPYIHYIEKIPIRQCHAKVDLKKNVSEPTAEIIRTDPSNATTNKEIVEPSTSESTMNAPTEPEKLTGELKTIPAAKSIIPEPEQPYLLKAYTRNILLMKVETVFNPYTDIKPYKGFRPIANFAVKNKAFYVHPELLFDETLRKQLAFLLEERPKPSEEDDDD